MTGRIEIPKKPTPLTIKLMPWSNRLYKIIPEKETISCCTEKISDLQSPPSRESLDFDWVKSVHLILDDLHYAIDLAKKIQEIQISGECACRSEEAHYLINALRKISEDTRVLDLRKHPINLARKCPFLVLGHISQARLWLIRALYSENTGIIAKFEKLFTFALQYAWFLLSTIADVWTYPALVSTTLKLGVQPKIVQCPCESEFNTDAIYGYLSLANAIFLTTLFMSSKCDRINYPSVSLGPMERKWIRNVPDHVTSYGCSTLHKKVFEEKLCKISQLLEKFPDLDTPDTLGYTPLHLAILFDDTRTAELLICAMDEVDIPDLAGNTPLHTAVLNQQIEIVNLLREDGADFLATCKAGCSPLKIALSLGNTRLMVAVTEKRPNDL